jgi:hypothetical protein
MVDAVKLDSSGSVKSVDESPERRTVSHTRATAMFTVLFVEEGRRIGRK